MKPIRGKAEGSLLGRLLCLLGLHDYRSEWCDDGKGNSGGFDQCRRCAHISEELV